MIHLLEPGCLGVWLDMTQTTAQCSIFYGTISSATWRIALVHQGQGCSPGRTRRKICYGLGCVELVQYGGGGYHRIDYSRYFRQGKNDVITSTKEQIKKYRDL